MKIYLDANDWWIGWYRVCLLPCIVIRWQRRGPSL
jgi:hypothetical protein